MTEGRRKRVYSRAYAVLEWRRETETYIPVRSDLVSSAAARDWIKKEGDAGGLYQVACLIGDTLSVNIVVEHKRSLLGGAPEAAKKKEGGQ